MSNNGEPTVAVKLFIDKEKKRVLYAESGSEFVDVLFSFLTLPLGRIVHLLGKRSQVGCLDELYKSVESLSEDHFQTKACKAMLLSPCNAAAAHCSQLKVKVDDSNRMYRCKDASCGCAIFSSVPDATCACGHPVQYIKQWTKKELSDPPMVEKSEGGAFAISVPKFIITDDLYVAPSCTSIMFSLIEKFGIPQKGNIEEKVLQLNSNKITSLLERAMLTKQPLTGLCFDVAIAPSVTDLCNLPENLFGAQFVADPKFRAINVRLVQLKEDSVLYAEVGQDFVDLAFGLLTIPLGTMMKSFNQLPQVGCIDNIYKSVDGSAKQECQTMLLSPKLPPYFGCSNNILQVEESVPRQLRIGQTSFYEWNPRYSTDRDYIKAGPMKFMVTNDLHIHPFCLTSTLEFLRASKIPTGKLVQKELTLNQTQALKFLWATFGTRKALSSLLLPSKK
ncbi:hypothetical protein QYE76_064509 [Lolium multiflorum]|uniref:DUF674 family protein n=1 Tax=Lolium multiflorum TaxID=4521 RepID=A0AAD8S7I9_LOLMU|nr:hypothetical protein QYE76_064509 [Lolium multiflorum]